MSLGWLDAVGFRNLENAHLDFSPGVNLLFGANGSGKTSVLESCFFLSQAKSHRSINLNPVIQKGQEEFLLRGEILQNGNHYQVGMSRNRDGKRAIRLNGEDVRKATDLAKLLPVLSLGPESVDLLLGSPGLRRRFLNWGVFHVEPGFGQVWQDANRSLKQRNALLRQDGANKAEIDSWTNQLVRAAMSLDQMREEFVRRYRPVFKSMILELTQRDDIDFDYYRGWSRDTELAEVLEKDRMTDQKKGFTQKGFQRADVRIRVAGETATQVCSRGELKSLVWGMVLAQGRVAERSNAGTTLYLVDDLASEFDEANRRRVCEVLVKSNQQVILTGVERDSLLEASNNQFGAMFHVKHGAIEEIR